MVAREGEDQPSVVYQGNEISLEKSAPYRLEDCL